MAAVAPAGARAQIPYTVFNDNTQVQSLDFRFPAGRAFSESRLKQEIVLTERGRLAGIRDALAILPLVSPTPPHPFSPLDLQRDVARLRRFYGLMGFLDTHIRYEVEYDQRRNRVDIDLIIVEGRPITLRVLEVVTAEGGDPADHLPGELRPQWNSILGQTRRQLGQRFNQAERVRHTRNVLDWWMDHGWAFARVETHAVIDTAQAAASLRIDLDPGPRARIGPITIEGAASVDEDVIRRTLPFAEGDWFSSRKVAEAQRRLFALELFRLALVDVAQDQQRDSTALVRVRLEERAPRLVTAELGYVSTAGIAARTEFAHRNFMGGARTLRIQSLAETGQLAYTDQPEQDYRLSLAFRQPWLFHPRLSLNVAPFGQYRDDLTDRSWQAGIESSLIYQLGEYRFLSFRHRLTSRRILDYRLGSGSAVDLLELIRLVGEGAIDTLTTRIDRSTFSLSAAIGRFDPTRPTDAAQVIPSIEFTAPPGLNTIEYVSVDVPVIGYLPLGDRTGLSARGRIGRVFPFGKTVEGDRIAGPLQAIQLRDVMLTAGGTGSVRGWGEGQLGPKYVDLRFIPIPGSDSLRLEPRGYAPGGGLARAIASLEFRLPFPGLGQDWGTHVFLDAGRVWNPDERFRPDDPFQQRRWFFGTGAGMDVNTLVGPIRVSLGYKLNPSPVDLRKPQDVFLALLEGRSLDTVPERRWRRFHLHVSLGQSF